SSIRWSRRRQSSARSLMTCTMRADSTSGGVAKMRGSSARKNRSPCLTGIPRSNRKADLIDDASALADQSLAHAMHRLQIELFGSLRCHKLQRRALNGLGDRLRITEVVLLSL